MATKSIKQSEVERYWEIFASLSGGGQHLDGSQAATVLKNSRLRDDQLERVWDLADVDSDGRLDFEEFCVAMRLIYDLVNGEMADVPRALPDWLVPESKAHFVQASRGLSGGHTRAQVLDEDSDDDGGTPGLRDGFDWSYSPAQLRDYEDIYAAVKDGHGYVTRPALEPFVSTLAVPDTDVNSAWNLINPGQDGAIGKDAAVYLLHVLRGRHDGFRLPRRAPPSLVHSFSSRGIEYNVDRVRAGAAREMADDSTASGRKAKFGDAYLSRLGSGGDRNYRPRGTDFGAKTTEDWEEVRLKKELRVLEDKMARVEEAARRREARGARADSKPALVKRELEQMLEYKRRELRDVQDGEGRAKDGQGLGVVREDLAEIERQIAAFQSHVEGRQRYLAELQGQVSEAKAR